MIYEKSYSSFLKMNSAGKKTESRIFSVPVWLLPLFLLLVALAVRLLCFHCDPICSRDGLHYMEILETMAVSENGEADYPAFGHVPPLFLLCGKTVMLSGFSARTSLLLLNFFCGCVFPLLLFYIIRHYIADGEISFEITILIAVFPPLVKNSVDLLREPLYFLLIAAAFALEIFAAARARNILFLPAGLFSGFLASGCCFVRAEGVAAMLLLLGYWTYAICVRRKILSGMAAWLCGMGAMVLLLWSAFPAFMLSRFFTERVLYWFSVL